MGLRADKRLAVYIYLTYIYLDDIMSLVPWVYLIFRPEKEIVVSIYCITFLVFGILGLTIFAFLVGRRYGMRLCQNRQKYILEVHSIEGVGEPTVMVEIINSPDFIHGVASDAFSALGVMVARWPGIFNIDEIDYSDRSLWPI